MIKAMLALETLIKENEDRLKSAQNRLKKHESGEETLSQAILGSIQNTIEVSEKNLEQYKKELDKLKEQNPDVLEKMEQLQDEAKKRLYYHFQKERVHRKKELPEDQKLEALMILDEFDDKVEIKDEILFEIARKSLKMRYGDIVENEKLFKEIKDKFEQDISKIEEPNIKNILELDRIIPITITQLSMFKKHLDSHKNKTKFHGFAKFQNWWFGEMFDTHQAYYALYQFKNSVIKYCSSDEEIDDFNHIFYKFVFIKKVLNDKGELTNQYHLIFDNLLKQYCDIEEELDIENIKAIDDIIKKNIDKINFNDISSNHNIINQYTKFKLHIKQESV